MSSAEFALLLLAGVAAGLAGSMTGLASVISYPALLAAGLPPVTANVTNTVALVFSGLGSTIGSRPELRGQGHRLRVLGVAGVLGGALGAALLLLTPSGSFELVVPWLIGLASLCVLTPRPKAHPERGSRDRNWVVGSVFLISLYGGYFGAAAGVVLLALLLAVTAETLQESNAMKNVVLFCANLVAAVGFVIFGDIRWLAALPLAVGFFVGGWLGPIVLRRLPATPLRIVIALAGVAIAIKLAIQAE
ncbi:MAG: sulfite exporter TauE/SafE family protein [Actinomycetota bacterium]|nr:sulfite exporter TauE/SafE family protein [Actinomycetota bacterium]MDQ2958902.1 sulfite exporter TauE/SafE family protein [Actinomycetota bacterium]